MKKLLPLAGVCLLGCDQVSEKIPGISSELPKHEVLIQSAGDVNTGVQRIINGQNGLAYDFRKATPRGLQTIIAWDTDADGTLDIQELQRGEIVLNTELGTEKNYIPEDQWERVQSGYETLSSVLKKN